MPAVDSVCINVAFANPVRMTDSSDGLIFKVTPGFRKTCFSEVVRVIIGERQNREMIFRQGPAYGGRKRKRQRTFRRMSLELRREEHRSA